MNLPLTPDLRTGSGRGFMIQGTIKMEGSKHNFVRTKTINPFWIPRYPVWESPSKTI